MWTAPLASLYRQHCLPCVCKNHYWSAVSQWMYVILIALFKDIRSQGGSAPRVERKTAAHLQSITIKRYLLAFNSPRWKTQVFVFSTQLTFHENSIWMPSNSIMHDGRVPQFTPTTGAGRRFNQIDWDIARQWSDHSVQVSIARLDSIPDYNALSYTWGPPLPKQAIFVDGKPVLFRQNLYDALLRIRAHMRTTEDQTSPKFMEEQMPRSGQSVTGPDQWRYFWIDSISINQNDVAELSI